MKNLIVWGSSGHAKVLHELFNSTEYNIVVFVDNNPNAKSAITNIPLVIGIQGLLDWLVSNNKTAEPLYGIVAIGGERGEDRLKIQNQLTDLGITIINAIHNSCYIATDALIGEGSQILAGAVIASSVIIGCGVIVNTSASIDHECILNDGVHVGPGATLSGCIEVGNHSFIGAGAVVLPRIKIGKNSIIGAGAVVTKNVGDNSTVVGNPAKQYFIKGKK